MKEINMQIAHIICIIYAKFENIELPFSSEENISYVVQNVPQSKRK